MRNQLIRKIKSSKTRRRKGSVPSSPVSREAVPRHSPAATDFDALRGSALKRMEHAIRDMVRIASEEELYEALATRTPVDALIHLISQGAMIAEAASRVDDPLRAARSRAAAHMSALLSAEGGPIGVEEVAERLHITRAAVDKRRKAGTLIGISDGGRSVLYPIWQLTDTGILPGLDDALRAIGVEDPWMRMQFFLVPDPDLGLRPLDALRQGRRQEVIASAQRYGRQGDDG